MTDDDLAVVVVAGGRSSRMGGVDKTRLPLEGRPLLDHVLDACPPSAPVVVVGPERPTPRAVVWALEQPPGGGPVAALAEGLRHVSRPLVLLLAGDAPRVTAAVGPVVEQARTAVAQGRDGAWGAGPDGRPQPLLACVARESLGAHLPVPATGRALRDLMRMLVLDVVVVPVGSLRDVDTPDDLDALEADGPGHRTREGAP